jgi:hypothetical protein
MGEAWEPSNKTMLFLPARTVKRAGLDEWKRGTLQPLPGTEQEYSSA